jgi:hypothetical protein
MDFIPYRSAVVHTRETISLPVDGSLLLADTLSRSNATQQGLTERNVAMNIFTGCRKTKRKNVRVRR